MDGTSDDDALRCKRLQELDHGDETSPGGSRSWQLDEPASLQSQAFFLLSQGTTEVALDRFQNLALFVVQLSATARRSGVSGGDGSSGLNMATKRRSRRQVAAGMTAAVLVRKLSPDGIT